MGVVFEVVSVVYIMVALAVAGIALYLAYLGIRALRKYLRS